MMESSAVRRHTTRGVPPRKLFKEAFIVQRKDEQPRKLKKYMSGPNREQRIESMDQNLKSHAVTETWELTESMAGRTAVGSK